MNSVRCITLTVEQIEKVLYVFSTVLKLLCIAYQAWKYMLFNKHISLVTLHFEFIVDKQQYT